MSSIKVVKVEPLSPRNNVDEVTWSSDTDTELYWTAEEFLEAADLVVTPENKSEVVSKILENLEQLEDLSEMIKEDEEDAFANNYWMEEKILPMYIPNSYESYKYAAEKVASPDPEESTQNLLMEFETVLDAVNNGAFTPPQSPPYQPVLTNLEPSNSNTFYTIVPNDHTYPVVIEKPIQFTPFPQPDVDHELAVVDELVRTRVERMVPSSPSSSSSSSNYGDSSSDDPEWNGEPIKASKSSRKRSNPYNYEDKKSRKKEQNKNAATRYRMKKKAEAEVILGEEKVLLQKKTELEINIGDLMREIKCLKGIMREVFTAKGLIN